MRFIFNVACPPPTSFQGHHSGHFCPYVPLTIQPFSLLCVVHLPVFLSFSVSLLESFAVSSVAKRASCFLKSAKLVVSAGNITSLGLAIKQHKLFLNY